MNNNRHDQVHMAAQVLKSSSETLATQSGWHELAFPLTLPIREHISQHYYELQQLALWLKATGCLLMQWGHQATVIDANENSCLLIGDFIIHANLPTPTFHIRYQHEENELVLDKEARRQSIRLWLDRMAEMNEGRYHKQSNKKAAPAPQTDMPF